MLGVRRSGTTLLRVMLDRHSRLAIPTSRTSSRSSPTGTAARSTSTRSSTIFADCRRCASGGSNRRGARERSDRPDPGRGDRRRLRDLRGGSWQGALGRQDADVHAALARCSSGSFPTALYVHLIRDGRDCALSFLQMAGGIVTRTWAHPRDAAGFACQWRSRGRRGTRAGTPRRPALHGAALRGARRRARARRFGKSATHVGLRSSPRCSTTRARSTSRAAAPAEPHAAADARLRDWRADMAEATLAPSRRSPATCSRSSATRSGAAATLRGRAGGSRMRAGSQRGTRPAVPSALARSGAGVIHRSSLTSVRGAIPARETP